MIRSQLATRVDRCHRAFSLLELILALTLSIFLMAGLVSAIYVNTLSLTRQRLNIERSQIARNVLMMVKNDLRAAVQYKPADVTGIESLGAGADLMSGLSGLEEVLAGAGGAVPGGAGGVVGGSGAVAGGAGAGAAGAGGAAAGTPSSSNNQNIASGDNEPSRPGLYGNTNELLIDISRLPRLDQYNPMVAGTEEEIVSIPSDIKTVAYFVSEESLDERLPTIGLEQAPRGGLYRRELDRAVAAYAYDVEGMMAAVAETRLIASEVVQINFRYFDGENWVNEWDSDLEGGFPSAVEVMVIVDNTRDAEAMSSVRSGASDFDPETMQLYRSVVYLPIAEILEEEESQAEGPPEQSAPSGAGAVPGGAASGGQGGAS